MKKGKLVKIILILSVAAFLTLLGIYIYGRIKNRPVTVSQREQYQEQLRNQEEEQ
ncbi:MAG: hypothetical protein J5712_07435 [Lachnospiraceae bacterium]|nr:hypothetical protein [Lachnospiraceae bacterium]MBO4559895.1 hypothetical protein [Lachnospiraceae bacterium]MBR5967444.1 hypothetical protein [Lachnospiraceae bacterium]